MLVFNEGVPGSGKSYDVVKNHVLPALKAKRKVFARLNGLDEPAKVEAIAAYLKMPLDEVHALLTHIPTQDLRTTLAAEQGEDGKWHLPDLFRNALVVIDEVHEFYVGGTREPLPQEQEQFFAMHRHKGADIVVMTQFYKRIHTAIRHRIEAKNAFQKLSVLGKIGEKKYTVRRFQTIMPDKYEQVGTETHSYDAAIFPLYRGVADDQVQTEVYKGGRSTVWRSMLGRALFIVPVGLVSIWYLIDFFSGGGTALVKTPEIQNQPGQVATKVDPYAYRAGGSTATPGTPAAPKPTPAQIAAEKRQAHIAELSVEQRYVWDLSENARIRLAAMIGTGPDARGMVEWVDGTQVVKERMSLDQVRALGVLVTVHAYGVRLEANGEAVVATAWPLNAPLRDERPELYNLSGRPGASSSDSETIAGPATASAGAAIAYAGTMPTGSAGGSQ